MSIIDKVNNKESEFFNKEARDAKYLILSPAAYQELKIVLAEEQGLDPDQAFLIEFGSYEGLKIAVKQVPHGEDIDIC